MLSTMRRESNVDKNEVRRVQNNMFRCLFDYGRGGNARASRVFLESTNATQRYNRIRRSQWRMEGTA